MIEGPCWWLVECLMSLLRREDGGDEVRGVRGGEREGVCVCVRERERETHTQRQRDRETEREVKIRVRDKEQIKQHNSLITPDAYSPDE